MTHINTALTDKLAELTDGLYWMSESDYLWQVFAWETPGPLTHEQLLQLADRDPGTPVEEVGFDEEKATARRYRELVEFLKYNLSDIKVYRMGQPAHIHIYIIGATRDDNPGRTVSYKEFTKI